MTTAGTPAAPGAASLRRWAAHVLTTPLHSRRAFPPPVLKAIRAAIETAEAGHSGEILFVAEGSVPWSYLRRGAPVRRRALALFSELRAWDTENNNGVLIYVGLADRAVEIVADRGIARLVDADTWQRICRALQERCAQGDYEGGAVAAVQEVGILLQRHFALRPGQTRTNEIPDRPLAL